MLVAATEMRRELLADEDGSPVPADTKVELGKTVMVSVSVSVMVDMTVDVVFAIVRLEGYGAAVTVRVTDFVTSTVLV